MRIVSGKYRGKKIPHPKSFHSRPTTDFAKEALFNILENRIDWEENEVLDLFAGTGNISGEFLSRGAKSVHSVDKHPAAMKSMWALHNELEDDQWKIIRMDVFKFIEKTPLKFDLIFADPPFDMKGYEKIPEFIFKTDILKKDGILIIEHGKENSFESMKEFKEVRNYGGVNFTFLSRD